MRVLQINTLGNSGSHGRIAEHIGLQVQKDGGESFIAFGRGESESKSELIKIGNQGGTYRHILRSRLLDRHGFDSYGATKAFLKKVSKIRPELIHLHNLHGYYIHVGLLFEYLAEKQIPVVWTLHDCWPFTGHCSYFDHVNCDRWKTHCYSCPNIKGYPTSWFIDQSERNFNDKRRLFTRLDKLVLVTPSKWLASLVSQSFLKLCPVEIINNGIDPGVFRPDTDTRHIEEKYNLTGKRIILGVASIWDKRKGLTDFVELSHALSSDEHIVLIGLSDKQIRGLPAHITGLGRTEDLQELVAFYNLAEVFVNPTYLDNFPTTNIEALACGTPVITYDTGGSPESVDDQTGAVLPKGDIQGLYRAIRRFMELDPGETGARCVQRARERYFMADRYAEYLDLYKQLLDRTGRSL